MLTLEDISNTSDNKYEKYYYFTESLIKKKNRQNVLVFSTSPWWINYVYFIILMIYKKNYVIHFFWSDTSEFDNIDKNLWKAYYNKLKTISSSSFNFLFFKILKNKIKNKKNIFIYDISNFFRSAEKINIDEYKDIDEKSEFDFIYFYRTYFDKKNSNHLIKLKHRKKIRKQIYKTTIYLINELKPNFAITNGAFYGENGSFYDACKNSKIDISVVESNLRSLNNKKCLHSIWNYTPLRFNNKWVNEYWHKFIEMNYYSFDQDYNEKLIAQIKDPKLSFMQVDYGKETLPNYILSSKNYKILIPTSYSTEIFRRQRHACFKTQELWLEETLKYLEEFDNLTVVIKLHPIAGDVGKNPSEDPLNVNVTQNAIRNIAYKYQSKQKDKYKIFDVDSEYNFYDIVEKFDLLITYSSMTSMEAPLYSVPVLSVNSDQHFTKKGFTYDVLQREKYYEQIYNFIHFKKKIEKSHVLNSQKYFYFYHRFLPNNFPIHVALPRYGIQNDHFYLDELYNLANILNGTFTSILKITNKSLEINLNHYKEMLDIFFTYMSLSSKSKNNDILLRIGDLDSVDNIYFEKYKDELSKQYKKNFDFLIEELNIEGYNSASSKLKQLIY